MTPTQSEYRAAAQDYDARALRARTKHEARALRAIARRHRLRALMAAYSLEGGDT